MSVRDEDGTWNDRVFPRSAAYGTAVTVLAFTEPAYAARPRAVVPPPAVVEAVDEGTKAEPANEGR